jgi:transposase
MDRGIPTEATLREMREAGTQYLVGTPRSMLGKLEQQFADKPWNQVHEAMQVKLAQHEGEFYVLAHSSPRQEKEKAMRRRRFKAYARGLHALRRRCREGQRAHISRDTLISRLAVLKKDAGRMSAALIIHMPDEGQKPTVKNFHYELNKDAYKKALDRDGSYILRSNAINEDAATMWSMYMQLVNIEAALKSMKSDLAIRPIRHYVQPRVEAHIFVAFMGYCLLTTLRKYLEPIAPGLSPKAVLEQLASIQMLEVCFPTSDGRWLIMPRHTEPESEQKMLLEKLALSLPPQPPPRIRSGKLLMPEPTEPAT